MSTSSNTNVARPFWKQTAGSKSPHTIDPIVVDTMRELHRMIADAGMEDRIELMEDGGLNANNVAQFIEVGMTVGEFSSPLLKGPDGKLQPGTGPDQRCRGKLARGHARGQRRFS